MGRVVSPATKVEKTRLDVSLKARLIIDIPEETVEVAQAAFPKGNVYLLMRDRLGSIYQDEDFAALFPTRGQPAEAPWRLALVTVLQFRENLTDRQAAEAVRSRIDWKYALGLRLKDPGFHFSVLSDFRARLLSGQAEDLLLDKLLTVFKEQGWLKAGQPQRTDATHVLAAIRQLTRIEMVGETLRQALNHLATVIPDWLHDHVTSDWYERYSKPFDDYHMPKSETALLALAEQIGRDGWQLLQHIDSEADFHWLRQIPALMTLQSVWQQQYDCQPTHVRWRDKAELPASADTICTPYDPQARYSRKREMNWTGYKVHLTETCAADAPHLITHVETTEATQSDSDIVDTIHTELEAHQLLPNTHIVDNAYVTSSTLVSSHQQQINLLGPVNPDNSWQAKAEQGFDVSHFQIDWDTQIVRCPSDQINDRWFEHKDRHGNPVIQVRFPRHACLNCPLRSQCTSSQQGARFLTLQPREQHAALQQARQRQMTESFKSLYRARAGVEGTISQAVHTSDLRHTRYRGLPKTHLQHLATAAALNVSRSVAWLMETPLAQTRTSRFAALAA
jgi:transposase